MGQICAGCALQTGNSLLLPPQIAQYALGGGSQRPSGVVSLISHAVAGPPFIAGPPPPPFLVLALPVGCH